MKIATLQFSPCVGDVEGNIRRADALLQQSLGKESDLDLDLLVLPELAFTGKFLLLYSSAHSLSLTFSRTFRKLGNEVSNCVSSLFVTSQEASVARRTRRRSTAAPHPTVPTN